MGIEFLLTGAFLKGCVACFFGGIGGLIIILIKHSFMLGAMQNEVKALGKRFERFESLIEKLCTT